MRSRITITQFRKIREGQNDNKSRAKQLSSSMLEDMAAETLHSSRRERGLGTFFFVAKSC